MDEITGILEVIGNQAGQIVTWEFLGSRRIYEIAYDSPFLLADLASKRAFGFGATNALASMLGYEMPQQWAFAFFSAGFEGIAYSARHATDGRATSLALFDEAGAHGWPICSVKMASSPDVIRQLRDWGVEVAGPPDLSDLDVIH